LTALSSRYRLDAAINLSERDRQHSEAADMLSILLKSA